MNAEVRSEPVKPFHGCGHGTPEELNVPAAFPESPEDFFLPHFVEGIWYGHYNALISPFRAFQKSGKVSLYGIAR